MGLTVMVAERVSADPHREFQSGTAPAALAGDDFDRDVWCVLGLPIDRTTLEEAGNAVFAAARDGRRLSFVTPNVNWLVRAHRETKARRQIIDADLSLADGAPIVLMARLLGTPIRERVAGSDLFDALRMRAGFPGRRLRVFFFGGRDGAAQAAAKRVNSERGGVEAVGWINPGFGDIETMSGASIIDEINDAKADFVLVSLGAAKGQDWIEKNQSRLNTPVISHLGAVVDFVAGGIPRAPAFLARSGLEWVYRILAEPALWRRYARDGLGFVKLVATRLAPQMTAKLKSAGRAGTATVSIHGSAAVVRLGGDLTAASLAPVRQAFRAAVAARTAVVLDCAELCGVDGAFLGQVLMLEKQTLRSGQELKVAGLSPRHRALFRANAMNYAEAAPALETEPAAEINRISAR